MPRVVGQARGPAAHDGHAETQVGHGAGAAATTVASASPADVLSTTPAEAGGSRVISRGDSLWALSRLAYGDGARYAVIYNANRAKIHNPNLIYPGQTFVLPQKAE